MNPTSSRIRQFFLKKLENHRPRYEQRVYNNLERLYGIIRPGDVVLVEGRSDMSRMIKLFSNSHWSHVALYVGNVLRKPDYNQEDVDLDRYGQDANHMVIEASSSEGVFASPLTKYRDFNIRICRPYGIMESDLHQVLEQVVGRLGTRYDDQNIAAIAIMVLKSMWRSRSRQQIRACLGNCNNYQVICSGMIAEAFQSVGYPIVPALLQKEKEEAFDDGNPYGAGLIMRHYTQIMPKDFDLSPNFEVIKFNIVGTPAFDYKSLWIDHI